ncbi:MAG: hypothetical protein V2I37_01755 [Marinilabiliaceae bacterium]|jgi:hypothetical protein|nr:hypothetical protein [Marinilabiliaceae bacterium]
MMKYIAITILAVLITGCSLNQSESGRLAGEEVFYFSVNDQGEGPWITLEFQRGDSFYYPLMAIWLEDLEGNYIQTLYVAKSVATSVFRFGNVKDNKWEPGIRRYPQTLPYWAHKRGVKAADGLYMPDPDKPIADAYTGATPLTGFVMSARADRQVESSVRIMLEVNQNWDWNEYWTNDLYPDDKFYKLSCQPAVVYQAVLDPALSGGEVLMKAIGHSHHSGASGELFPDLSTLTSALTIADSIIVRFGR